MKIRDALRGGIVKNRAGERPVLAQARRKAEAARPGPSSGERLKERLIRSALGRLVALAFPEAGPDFRQDSINDLRAVLGRRRTILDARLEATRKPDKE